MYIPVFPVLQILDIGFEIKIRMNTVIMEEINGV
jgi:hypothetical protein